MRSMILFVSVWIFLTGGLGFSQARAQTPPDFKKLLSQAAYYPTPYPAKAETLLKIAYPKLAAKVGKIVKVHFTYIAIPNCGTWAHVIAEGENGSSYMEFATEGAQPLKPTSEAAEHLGFTPVAETIQRQLDPNDYLCGED